MFGGYVSSLEGILWVVPLPNNSHLFPLWFWAPSDLGIARCRMFRTPSKMMKLIKKLKWKPYHRRSTWPFSSKALVQWSLFATTEESPKASVDWYQAVSSCNDAFHLKRWKNCEDMWQPRALVLIAVSRQDLCTTHCNPQRPKTMYVVWCSQERNPPVSA